MGLFDRLFAKRGSIAGLVEAEGLPANMLGYIITVVFFREGDPRPTQGAVHHGGHETPRRHVARGYRPV